jgi:hypothetical protein
MILTLFLQGAKPPVIPQAFTSILVTFHPDDQTWYSNFVPPLLFLLRVRIIFLRPPPAASATHPYTRPPSWLFDELKWVQSPSRPPLLVLLRVRIIFLRPPPLDSPVITSFLPVTCTTPNPSPPLLVHRCILAPLRFEHRFAIFVLYITKIKN